jgi:NifU-like protein involved in Fe-S cluster formation
MDDLYRDYILDHYKQPRNFGELGADWMIELLGIPVSATRRKCALLNLKVVRGAVTGDHAWPA